MTSTASRREGDAEELPFEDDGFDRVFSTFGHMFAVMARQQLGERFGELRSAVIDVWGRYNEGENGSLRLPQEYLQAIVRL